MTNAIIKALQDGNEFVAFQIADLKEAEIYPDKMIINEKIYHMMPSSAAALILFLEYMKTKEKEVHPAKEEEK